MDFQRTSRQFKEINLTALIDIVFHLMVFVMLTTSFVVAESMELSLPSAKSSAPLPAGSVLRIQISPDGSVVVDNQPMNMEQMNAVLGTRIAANADVKIAVLSTPGVSVQQLIAVLDAVYLTGGRNVQVDKAS
jgi:biopolymer transport protein ExbD